MFCDQTEWIRCTGEAFYITLFVIWSKGTTLTRIAWKEIYCLVPIVTMELNMGLKRL